MVAAVLHCEKASIFSLSGKRATLPSGCGMIISSPAPRSSLLGRSLNPMATVFLYSKACLRSSSCPRAFDSTETARMETLEAIRGDSSHTFILAPLEFVGCETGDAGSSALHLILCLSR
jgi:hypothetical protein